VTPENYSFGKKSRWLVRCSGIELKNAVTVFGEALSTEGE
jgi:hypothetical protein